MGTFVVKSLTYSLNQCNTFLCFGDIENKHSTSKPPSSKFFEYGGLPFTYISTLPLCFRFYLYAQLHAYHVRQKHHCYSEFFQVQVAKSLEKRGSHKSKAGFQMFLSKQVAIISSSTFSIIFLIHRNILNVLFRVFITVCC